MRQFSRALISICLLLVSFSMSAQDAFLGSWSGKLSVGPTTLTIVINLAQDPDGSIVCTMDSPDQSANGIKATASISPLGALEVTVASLGASYKGILVGKSLVGTFTQLGQEFPLTFNKGVEKPNRLQNPVAPFPYTEEEIIFENEKAGAVLAGTLVLPEKAAAGAPVVLFVSGSGQEDRNEEIYEHKPFLVIADYLARNGIASLRYDDRNFGASRGGEVANATTLDFLEDARSGVGFLKSRGCFGRIGVIGHSEGADIAFMLGAAGDADFIVSLGGTGVKGDEALMAQANRIFELQGIDRRYTLQEYRSTVRAQKSPWLNWFVDYDPTADIQSCKCPVFAANGDRDCQVISSLNLTAIREKLPSGESNLIKEYPELNHLFQHCQTGLPTEYRSIEETFAPEVLSDLTEWILHGSFHTDRKALQ